MNAIAPKKLLNSKWTAVSPENKEKHFLVTKVKIDDLGNVTLCELEAILSKRKEAINWRDLKEPAKWLQGWQ